MRTSKLTLKMMTMAVTVLAASAVSAAAQTPAAPAAPARAGGAPAAPPMTLTTTGWPDGDDIPVKFTQAGEQVSPQLSWTNAPANTQSFVLLMHDPDVALNGTTDDQLHWLVWNIPATAAGLPEHVPQGSSLPDGSMQVSATGPVYRGPGAPATGPKHHYTIEIFALDTKLDVQPAATWQETRANVVKAMQGHVRGKAVYAGLFHRPQ
jgi:Raf kinase inhibitor-like YbhB/YbcL family protein